MNHAAYIIWLILLICSSCLSDMNDSQVKEQKKAGALSFQTALIAKESIQNGDIILKRGKGIISNQIIKVLNESIPLSHCAIIVCEKSSKYVIHSVAREISGKDGVQTMRFNDFIKDCHPGHTYILRHKSDTAHRKQAVEKAKHFLELQIPFDYDFDLQNSNKMYCTELIHHVLLETFDKHYFEQQQIGDKKLLLFNSILDTVNFEIFRMK